MKHQNNSGPKNPKNPLQPKGLGDSPIVWNSGMGDPTNLGAFFSGDASFVDGDSGVQLSNESSDSIGSLYWDKNFDYTNDLYIKMTLFAFHSGGSGGLGWTLFLGSNTNNTTINDSTGSINVFLDNNFYNSLDTDAVSLYVDGTKVGGEGANYYTYEYLDDWVSRTIEILYQHENVDTNYITVFMDGKYICKANVGTWSPGGNYIGITGKSSVDTNYVNNHYIKSIEVRSIVPWLSVNYPTVGIKKDDIYLFINENYVDYVADPAGNGYHEANNIIAKLDEELIDYTTFTDISENGWNDVFNRAGYVIIPELEKDDLNPNLSSGAKNKIKNIVQYGGKLIMFCPNSGDLAQVLNDVFSFSIGGEGGASEPISKTVDGNALFPAASATIPSLSATSSLPTNTLPVDSVTIYEGNAGNQSVVTMIPYGSGKIYVLGWDWFNAAPLGPEDGGWISLLLSILQS